MTATTNRFTSARRHLDVLEEAWKADHVEAMRCRDLETILAQGVMVFQFIEWSNESWRERVYRGIEPLTSEDEQAIKSAYIRWLALTDEVATELVQLEAAFGIVENGDTIRDCQSRARRTLTKWVSPVLARSPAMRVWDVTEEEADELRELLNAPAGAPGRLKVEPKSIPVGDASVLS
jgi:hypothetical protein